MNRPQVIGQPTSQEHFASGLNIIADLLAPTLGPTGGFVVSETERSTKYEYLSDSSVAVRRIISLGDPKLDVGAMAMRNIIWRIGQRAGDGGATTAVLTRAIFNEGTRLLASGINAMQLTRGLSHASELALEALQAQTRPVQSEDELAAVARTITNDDALSAILGEMSYLLGADAHIIIEKYVAPYLERRYIAGAHYKSEISSMYFYTDVARKTAVLAAPAIALVDETLSRTDQVIPLLEAAIARGSKTLVVIAKNVTGEALNLLVTNHQTPEEQKKLDILAVKLSSVGDELRFAKSDLVLMTGATLLGGDGIRSLEKTQPDDLGDAMRVEFSSKALVVLPLDAMRPAIQEEVTNLRAYLNNLPMDDEDRPKVIKRLSTLSGGVGELKIGALTRTERAHRESQAERAFKVLSAAQRNGVVAGGGAAFVHCAQVLRDAARNGDHTEDTIIGINLLADALSKPLEQIVVNTGTDSPSVVRNRIEEAGVPSTYDAMTGKTVDAFESGVLDVTDVAALVLKTAVSGAMMVLSTDTIVYHKNPEQVLTT
jgi:chaperonin GroEL